MCTENVLGRMNNWFYHIIILLEVNTAYESATYDVRVSEERKAQSTLTCLFSTSSNNARKKTVEMKYNDDNNDHFFVNIYSCIVEIFIVRALQKKISENFYCCFVWESLK